MIEGTYEVRRDPEDPGVVELYWVCNNGRDEDRLLELREEELAPLALVLMMAVQPAKEEEL